MKTTLQVSLTTVAALSFAASTMAWSDGFESYPVGVLPPQGGWTDFGGSQPITVSTLQAHSGTKSMRLSEGTASGNGYGSDVYLNFQGAPISGKIVNFSYWQFIESSVDSIAWMYISTGTMPNNFQTGLDLRAGATTAGNVFGANMLVAQDIAGTPTLMATQPIVTGRWVEYNMTINLIANQFDMKYDGLSTITGGQWDTTPGDGVTLGGLDFWMQIGNANGINAGVFYDDFSLTVIPEPSALLIIPFGLALLQFGRRRRQS